MVGCCFQTGRRLGHRDFPRGQVALGFGGLLAGPQGLLPESGSHASASLSCWCTAPQQPLCAAADPLRHALRPAHLRGSQSCVPWSTLGTNASSMHLQTAAWLRAAYRAKPQPEWTQSEIGICRVQLLKFRIILSQEGLWPLLQAKVCLCTQPPGNLQHCRGN